MDRYNLPRNSGSFKYESMKSDGMKQAKNIQIARSHDHKKCDKLLDKQSEDKGRDRSRSKGDK